MANDCLVTKLKGVVNNDDLKYLGYITVDKIKAGLGRVAVASTTLSCTCKIIGEGHFTNETGAQDLGKEQTKPNVEGGTAQFYVSSDVTRFLIKNDYDFEVVNLRYNDNTHSTKMNIEDLRYIPTLKIINTSRSDAYGDISKLTEPYFTEIRLYDSRVSGNLYEICQHCKNSLTAVQHSSYTVIEGSLSPMELYSNIPNLESVNGYAVGQFDGDFSLLGNTKLNLAEVTVESPDTTGSIEEFVANKRAAGMTTGSLTFNGAGRTSVTYNGSPITTTNITVTWTADSITVV